MYGMLGGARNTFFDMAASSELRDNLRVSLQKIEMELRNSGRGYAVESYDDTGCKSADKATAEAAFSAASAAAVTEKFTITSGGSDSIRFSVPVLCSDHDPLLDACGNPAHWGAGLTWGCNSSACMDADNTCATGINPFVDYKFIEYAVNAGTRQLERSVFDSSSVFVTTEVIGRNITGMVISADATMNITVTLTAQRVSGTSRMVTETASQTIRLMN
jgi:hypothetical protein